MRSVLVLALAASSIACASAPAPTPVDPSPTPATAATPSVAAVTPTTTTAPQRVCSHERPTSCAKPQLDFAKDVEPILAKRCFGCHAGSGEVALEHNFSRVPSVLSHKQGIARRLSQCSMPPQGSEPPTPDEVQVILGWLACQK